MSKELANIIKILFTAFILTFVWHSAVAKTITFNVDGKEVITITVLEEITVSPGVPGAATGAPIETEAEEEPDCE